MDHRPWTIDRGRSLKCNIFLEIIVEGLVYGPWSIVHDLPQNRILSFSLQFLFRKRLSTATNLKLLILEVENSIACLVAVVIAFITNSAQYKWSSVFRSKSMSNITPFLYHDVTTLSKLCFCLS